MRAHASRARTAAAAFPALALLTQCAKKPEPLPTQNVTATEIVAQNAKDAFATLLDPKADHDSMQAYATSIAGARNRQDLAGAWNRVPGLAGKGATFLEELADKRPVPVVLIAPKDHLDLDSLDFDPDAMRQLMDQGLATAKTALDGIL